MGSIKSCDIADIAQKINALANSCCDPYVLDDDGFTAWELKQDLYQVKCLVDDAISRCPSFGDVEKRWLIEQEQKKIIRILKNE
jgi:hypothetical protein